MGKEEGRVEGGKWRGRKRETGRKRQMETEMEGETGEGDGEGDREMETDERRGIRELGQETRLGHMCVELERGVGEVDGQQG